MDVKFRPSKRIGIITYPLKQFTLWVTILFLSLIILITGSVIGGGRIAERDARIALTKELETRLILEARNLANTSAGALLSEFPELTLHPYVKEVMNGRTDLALLCVVDHNGIIQGHADAQKLGATFELDENFESAAARSQLADSEILLENSEILLIKTPILHPNGQNLGTSIVGLECSHIDAALLEARKKQTIFLVPILGATILLTLIMMSILLKPIGVIRAGLERIGKGDLDVRLDLPTRTEFGHLAKSINEMAGALKLAQRDLVEKERMDHEMELARQIQQSLLPRESTVIDDFIIAGTQEAAEQVGGDYYNMFPLSNGRVGFVIADVAGKGLGGCLVTSMIDVLMRSLCPLYTSPSALMVALEASLIDSLQPGVFVTMFYGTLDPDSGNLVYASAGHNPVLHYHAATKQIEYRKPDGVPLGLFRDDSLKSSLRDNSINLEPGDLVLESTDGFNEAINVRGEEFGFDRMEDILNKFAARGSREVIKHLRYAVSEWEKPLPAMDDKTLLVISRAQPVQLENTGDSDLTATSLLNGFGSELLDQLWKRRSNSQHFFLPASLGALDDIGSWVKQCTYLEKLSLEDLKLLEQGLYELCGNIAEHGCGLDPQKVIDIWWIADVSEDERNSDAPGQKESIADSLDDHINKSYFLVRDQGIPPNTDEWLSWDSNNPRMRVEGRGLGLGIIYRTLDGIEFHPRTEFGNITIMKYKMTERQLS
jgi:sigma-B regulation protein RsbU (phosphoserine phosphatase)